MALNCEVGYVFITQMGRKVSSLYLQNAPGKHDTADLPTYNMTEIQHSSGRPIARQPTALAHSAQRVRPRYQEKAVGP